MDFAGVLGWVVASGPNFVTAVLGVLSALIVVFTLVPGEQPEKALQGFVDFLSKFSAKKKE